jgi:hypothetical protein
MKLHERTRVLDEPALRSPDLFWALAPLCLLGAVALVARRADLGAVTWLAWTATWLVILVVRLVDTFGRMPLFFRGAPPRLTWLDAVVALYLIVWGLGLAHRALPPLPFLVAFPVLRLSRWASERLVLPIPEGEEVRMAGHLTGVTGRVGWSSRPAPRAETALVADSWATERRPIYSNGPLFYGTSLESFVVGAMVGSVASALTLLAPLLDWLSRGETGLTWIARLGPEVWIAPALAASSYLGRSASWPGSVVVLERSAFGVARWLPLALSGVVGAIAATAPASSGSEGVSYVQACLAALAATFLADRVSRVGMIDLEASGRVVLRIHGTALVVTDGRAHGADVVLETAVGPVRVTWPGVTGLRGVEFARGLAALVRRGDP